MRSHRLSFFGYDFYEFSRFNFQLPQMTSKHHTKQKSPWIHCLVSGCNMRDPSRLPFIRYRVLEILTLWFPGSSMTLNLHEEQQASWTWREDGSIYLPIMRSIKFTFHEISSLRGFRLLRSGDPHHIQPSIKYSYIVLNTGHPYANYEIPQYYLFQIVITGRSL